jgi:hypothetical protein
MVEDYMIKLFDKSKNPENKRIVIFVCVANSGRSQMAEGFFRKICSTRLCGNKCWNKAVRRD